MQTLVNASYGIAMGQRPPIHAATAQHQRSDAASCEAITDEPRRPRNDWASALRAGLAAVRSVRYRFRKLAAAFTG